jgi:hypothetical protein
MGANVMYHPNYVSRQLHSHVTRGQIEEARGALRRLVNEIGELVVLSREAHRDSQKAARGLVKMSAARLENQARENEGVRKKAQERERAEQGLREMQQCRENVRRENVRLREELRGEAVAAKEHAEALQACVLCWRQHGEEAFGDLQVPLAAVESGSRLAYIFYWNRLAEARCRSSPRRCVLGPNAKPRRGVLRCRRRPNLSPGHLAGAAPGNRAPTLSLRAAHLLCPKP